MKVLLLSAAWIVGLGSVALSQAPGRNDWPVHDPSRPLPSVVKPPETTPLGHPPPPGAVSLFDGSGLSAWNPTGWTLGEGFLEVKPGAGPLVSRQAFGSCKLHIEWCAPNPPEAEGGQRRGNSGVFLMGKYEVQILDAYENPTYADGTAGAIYGQYPPSALPVKPPGEWQVYEIEFQRPVFDASGALLRPAKITVDWNGVRVQDGVELTGPTGHKSRPPYKAHADALPLVLQDHTDAVRFRNIWILPVNDN